MPSSTAAPPRSSTPSTYNPDIHIYERRLAATRFRSTTHPPNPKPDPPHPSPIYEVDPTLTGLGSADLLRHFHHAGLVYAAQGRFADAFDAFKTVRCQIVITCLPIE